MPGLTATSTRSRFNSFAGSVSHDTATTLARPPNNDNASSIGTHGEAHEAKNSSRTGLSGRGGNSRFVPSGRLSSELQSHAELDPELQPQNTTAANHALADQSLSAEPSIMLCEPNVV